MSFNERLKQLCIEKNIDQNGLASMVGITQSAVSKYLNSQIPSFEIGLRISKVLKIDPYILFNESNLVFDKDESYGQLDKIKKTILSLDSDDQKNLIEWFKEINS